MSALYGDVTPGRSIRTGLPNAVENTGRAVQEGSIEDLVQGLADSCTIAVCEQGQKEGPSLDRIPLEIILNICSYLQPQEITQSLVGVCRKFRDIFFNEEYWRVRLKKRWHSSYPIIPITEDVEAESPSIWRRRSHIREKQFDMFSNFSSKMCGRIIGPEQGAMHYGDINCMAFGPNGSYLATGGRDRQVILWNLEKLKAQTDPLEKPPPEAQTSLLSHGGWVWSLQTLDNLLSSGAWDNTINIADLNHPHKPKAQTLLCTQAVTCHSWELGYNNRYIVAGTIFGMTAVFDPKAGNKPVMKKSQREKEAVLGLQLAGRHQVITVGSDRKMHVLDLRKNEFVVGKSIPGNDFGTKLHVNEGHVWVGTRHGRVYLYDEHDLELVGDFSNDLGLTDHITGLHYDCGHLMACGLDKNASVVEPVRQPKKLWDMQSDTGFTALSYSADCTFALAWGPVFGLWWPRDSSYS